MKFFFGYVYDDLRKKKFVEKKKIVEILFFIGGGLRSPAPPTGAAPLDPPCFWIEDSSGNMFALNGILAKNQHFFHQKYFFSYLKKKFLKSSESYPKKISSKSDEKKKFWSHFSLFSHFKSIISQKL